MTATHPDRAPEGVARDAGSISVATGGKPFPLGRPVIT
jgi:hypothetical protein